MTILTCQGPFLAIVFNSGILPDIGQKLKNCPGFCVVRRTIYHLTAARIIRGRNALSEHLGEKRALDTAEDTGGISNALPDSQLFGYRLAVDDLVKEAGRRRRPSNLLAAERFAAKHLGQPEFTAVFSRLDGGADVVAIRLISEIRAYRPSARSSASDLWTLVRIYLLSLVDSVWWKGTAPFVSDADVLCSNELVDLRPLRSAKLLQFQFHTQPAGLSGRVLDWVQHHALPGIRPRVAGLRFTRSRPAVVAVINQIARELAATLPARTPPLWVTSMVRSEQHQHHLRSLGYPAVLPSSHCVGYACDLETLWFRRFDQENRLARLLLERQESGQLNVIDEGHAWHVCVNPLACEELQAAYDAQLRVR
jgi:hypothetical protein